MSGKEDGDDKGFADEIEGVKPLRGRDKLRPPPEAKPSPAPHSPNARRQAFVIERRGDDVFARREDVSRKQLVELRAGRVPVEREVDLHGLDETAARRALLAAIERAREDGLRCLLVIHGAGHHSQAGPVLKRALPDWLTEDGVAGHLLAFATASSRLGGPGTTLLLLRRTRRR